MIKKNWDEERFQLLMKKAYKLNNEWMGIIEKFREEIKNMKKNKIEKIDCLQCPYYGKRN